MDMNLVSNFKITGKTSRSSFTKINATFIRSGVIGEHECNISITPDLSAYVDVVRDSSGKMVRSQEDDEDMLIISLFRELTEQAVVHYKDKLDPEEREWCLAILSHFGMIQYTSGGFRRNLIVALYSADARNKRILREAYPSLAWPMTAMDFAGGSDRMIELVNRHKEAL